jgi:UDP-3-O-[3-hydroxymyristoyl] glucosamine N-acyltransferase
VKRALTMLAILLLPPRCKPPLLRLLGHAVHRRASIGMSLVLANQLALDEDATIASCSLISCRRLVMRKSAQIGTLTVIRGPIDVWLGPRAAIGHRNIVTRAAAPVSIGPAQLRLGELATITSGHRVDCMAGKVDIGRNVYIGSQSCIGAGVHIGDAITVGAHSSVATDLTEPGLYVSQALRHIAGTPYARLGAHQTVDGPALVERVYRRQQKLKR